MRAFVEHVTSCEECNNWQDMVDEKEIAEEVMEVEQMNCFESSLEE